MPRIDLIQLRGGTAAEWTAANPVLELHEPGVESDTKKVKYGDGVTAWNSLDYATNPGEGGTYDLESPTTTTVGLMPSGSNITGLTWQEIIQWITTGIGPVVGGEILWGSTVELMGSTILTFAS